MIDKILIWTYNLTEFTYECVEVDYIKSNKQAVVKREDKDNTKVYVKFELTEELAKQRIKDYLTKEIKARLRRVHKLIEIHSKYEEDSFKRFVVQPLTD